jgi:Flp pilus assembly protein TadD
MNTICRMWLPMMIAVFATASGCATAPSKATARAADDELRDTGRDVLFATEFPVVDKTDAMARASTAWTAGDFDRALFFYVKALQYDPEDVNLLVRIGNIHNIQGNEAMAVRSFSMALRVDPDHAAALEARGLIALAHDETEIADADLHRAIDLNPTAWRAFNGLGILHDKLGEHEIAVIHFDAALSLVPNSAIVLNNRGYSRFLAGDYDGAAADLHAAADLGDYEPAFMNLGVLYARQRRYTPAIDMYRKVLDDAQTFNKVAEAAMINSDYEMAERLLEQAIHESPTYFPVAEENLQRTRLHLR